MWATRAAAATVAAMTDLQYVYEVSRLAIHPVDENPGPFTPPLGCRVSSPMHRLERVHMNSTR
jgi:hypothetical protein